MSWFYKRESGIYVWVCTSYTDLRYDEINNFAEYGQPRSPYQPGYNHNFEKHTNFSSITIEMPQKEVMLRGYGRSIKLEDFLVVRQFLAGGIAAKDGSYSFQDLLGMKLVNPSDRFMKRSLYGFGDPGEIDSAEAAYIHGTVGFALMASTRFIVSGTGREIVAELGALDDNWDFESSNSLVSKVEPIVQALLGPTHYNLEKPITIRFVGPGIVMRKSSTVSDLIK